MSRFLTGWPTRAALVAFTFSLCPAYASPINPPSYTVTKLGPTANAQGFSASDLNASGQVAGTATLTTPPPAYGSPAPTQAALEADGLFLLLNPPAGYAYSQAFGLANNGAVVGQVLSADGTQQQATLWRPGVTTPTLLGNLGGVSTAFAVNSAQTVVGQSALTMPTNPYSGEFVPYHAFRWSDATGVQDLGTLPGGQLSSARAITTDGLIAGYSETRDPLYGTITHAATWQGATVTDLGALYTGDNSEAFSINSIGQAVGYTGSDAALWQGGQITDLGTLGGTQSQASGINDAGQAVGYSISPDGQDGALWENGTAYDLYDLNGLIPADAGWTLGPATAINDAGQIIGQGTYQGQTATYLLTPTTVPASAPKITSLTPATVVSGTLGTSQGVPLTVTGTGFSPSAVVDLDGRPLSTSYVSSTTVTAAIPASYLAQFFNTYVSNYLGFPATITVVNPGPGGTSAASLLPVIYPTPHLTGLYTPDITSPGFVSIGVFGTGFPSHSQIYWNNTPLSTFLPNAGTATAYVPQSAVTGTGYALLTVHTPGIYGSTSNPLVYAFGHGRLSAGLSLFRNPVGGNNGPGYTGFLGLLNYGPGSTGDSSGNVNNLRFTQITVGGTSASGLPIVYGNLPVGYSAGVGPLSFPASVGAPGAMVIVHITATYDGGVYTTTQRVTLPT